MVLSPEDIVGVHYKIIKQIGTGNFGETYLAEDLYAKKRYCAVKRFNFESNNPDDFKKAKELFEREADVLYNLTNQPINNQIPKFIAYFDENQEFYLVQEFIEGQTLNDELDQITKLEEDKVVNLLKDVLKTLKFIHGKNIIHRDIKPQNLIRRVQDDKIVLIDFGAVKEVVVQSANTSSQKENTRVYTENYAPREQCQGKPKYNSDIYALGMTSLQALTGLEPDKLKDPHTGEVIWGSQIQISKNLAEVLKKMVDEDYERRYQSADDVLNAISKKTWIVSPGNRQLSLITHLSTGAKPIILRHMFVVSVIGMVIVSAISFFVGKTSITPPRTISKSSEANASSEGSASPPLTTSKSSEGSPSPPPTSPSPHHKPQTNCPPFITPGDDCRKK